MPPLQPTRRDFLIASASLAAGTAFGSAAPTVDSPSPKAGPFRAGAAVADITPELGVSLDGLLQMLGPVKEVHDPLRARCLALDNGQTRLVLVLCDSCLISGELIEKAKALAHQKTGLAKKRMLVAATHTHMAPRLAGWVGGKIDRQYYELVAGRIAAGIEQAIANLAPARLGARASAQGQFLANRRWIMKPGTVPPNPFGETSDKVVMGGRPAKHRLKPAGPIDPDLTVLSVKHADGKPLALLGNFGLHTGIFRQGVASADYFGQFSERVRELLDAESQEPPFVGIMSNGASGDIGALGGNFDRVEKVSDALATAAVHLAKKTDYRDRGVLAMRESEIELGVRKPSAERIAWAKKILADPTAKLPHRRSRIFAEEMLHMAEFPDRVPVKLQALRIGNVGIVAVPGEVFAETGLAIKKASPLKPTFVISHANGWHGYIPPPEQHRLGGMEVWLRRASYLEMDAATKIEAELIRLLMEIAQPR